MTPDVPEVPESGPIPGVEGGWDGAELSEEDHAILDSIWDRVDELTDDESPEPEDD